MTNCLWIHFYQSNLFAVMVICRWIQTKTIYKMCHAILMCHTCSLMYSMCKNVHDMQGKLLRWAFSVGSVHHSGECDLPPSLPQHHSRAQKSLWSHPVLFADEWPLLSHTLKILLKEQRWQQPYQLLSQFLSSYFLLSLTLQPLPHWLVMGEFGG